MECGEYEWRAEMARGPSAVGLQLKFSSERGVPLALAARVSRQPARAAALEPPPPARGLTLIPPAYSPFMSDMDEISYWIYTKRAPCLMNYDNLIKKQSEEAQCSKNVTEEVPSPMKRKKKRKLSMLDEDSISTEKQQNVYFEVSQHQNKPEMNSCKSDSIGSDVDFNIKNTTPEKPKKARLQKNNRAKIHKKPKVVTSTPKPPINLRRSLRQAQQSTNNAHLNSSYEMFNTVVMANGHVKTNSNPAQKLIDKVNKATEMFATGDGNQNSYKKTTLKTKPKHTAQLNGQFEDLSDVSGFTANYIRSTKVQSSKTPKKLRCKSARNLVKESQQRNNNMVVCVNKSMNTGVPNTNVLNCSTDSSQNVINLVTTRNNNKADKLDKSTSLLKFVDTRSKSKDNKVKHKSKLNVSYQSQSSAASRYPKRYKKHTDINQDNDINTQTRSANKNSLEYNNSDKKENPEAVVSRTRSGRNIGISRHFQRENSVLVVSNSAEQVSSMVSMNVAEPIAETRKRRPTRQLRSNKDKSRNLRRDSLRDKSGFTACFSESDDDSVPLVQRKYFCN